MAVSGAAFYENLTIVTLNIPDGIFRVGCECRRIDGGINHFDRGLVERGAFLDIIVILFVVLKIVAQLDSDAKLVQGRLASQGPAIGPLGVPLFIFLDKEFFASLTVFFALLFKLIFCFSSVSPWNRFTVDHLERTCVQKKTQ